MASHNNVYFTGCQS